MKELNVWLSCLSLLNPGRDRESYVYEDRGKAWKVQGFSTNEAPAKRVIEKLHRDHGKVLHRVVLLCSEEARGEIGENMNSANGKPGKISETFSEEFEKNFPGKPAKKIFHMTHAQYFQGVIQEYARKTDDRAYKEEPIAFEIIPVKNFLDEKEVAQAVVMSVEEVMRPNEKINLYVDFNGGPRVVTMLTLALCNLLELRDVRVMDRTYVDFESKKSRREVDGISCIMIQNMGAIFRCVDLVSGIREYVNYGRIRELKQYFEPCKNERIHRILQLLEEFANDMQLCLTDYVLNKKELVKKELSAWQSESSEEEKGDVYEIMFSFVTKDILRGCHNLIEGNLPRMIQWCVEKEFIQQALVFYNQEMPQFFRESGIFKPSENETREYLRWLEDQRLAEENTVINTPEYRSMDPDCLWLNFYLEQIRPVSPICAKKDIGLNKNADFSWDAYDMYFVVGNGDGLLRRAADRAECILNLLLPDVGRAETCLYISDPGILNELRQVLTEYYLIQSQCEGVGRSRTALGDQGNLWSYDEMCRGLNMAVNRLNRLLS